MDIFKNLKGHSVVEMNVSTGLRTGHLLAQQAYGAATAKNKAGETVNYLDNGSLLSLNEKGEIVQATDLTGRVYVHYSEEHMKFLDSASLDMFTVQLSAGEKSYPRAIALYEGDKFTTDNYKAAAALDFDVYYAITVANGVIQVGEKATAGHAGPIAQLSSLPAGQEAIEVLWRGV